MAFNFYKDPSFKKPFSEMNKAERDLAIYELNTYINEVFDSHLSDDMIAYLGQNLARAKRGQKPNEHLGLSDTPVQSGGAHEGEYVKNIFSLKTKDPFDF
ncbi:hypothetical protein [Rhizobium sp. BK602]|uniref:hypothetical protein n=1 Tax=Rhizobium sp. BK602 TaxID=2586986 RepID=UPI00160BC961|nr:hypothetical protein [Rhizobium sp. BK602]MBB3608196.1 hypothetical protein [Rhizobium sp. BK602]